MGWLLNAKQATLIAAALMLTFIGLLPLFLMIASSFWVDGEFGLRNYVEVFGNMRTWILFRNSLVLAVLTTALAGAIGITLGILIAKTDVPLGKTWVVVFTLPL